MKKSAMKAYGFTAGDTGDTNMASNLLKIQVYFTSLNVETIAESPTYQVIILINISTCTVSIVIYLNVK